MNKLIQKIMPAMIPIGISACAHTANTSFVENNGYFPADRESDFVKERVNQKDGTLYGISTNFTDIKGNGTDERDNYFESRLSSIGDENELEIIYQEGSFAKYINAFDTTPLPGYETVNIVEILNGEETSYQLDLFVGNHYTNTITNVNVINLPNGERYHSHSTQNNNSSILRGRKVEQAATLFNAVNSISEVLEEGNIETRILLGYDEDFSDELNVLLSEGTLRL
ncbi:hypothetical protein HN385_05700 [archaeon]|jgi:hypothetical protein|nr:hypothetical protein [archaeon]MBT3451460.1 hypothetical protein [archaeon]MBT6868546.1 hypothetical protein [archaeon]MBT7193080.1 hypothetical protein [archaeon]MBT7381169.1 hypothetical protein [archaeon]